MSYDIDISFMARFFGDTSLFTRLRSLICIILLLLLITSNHSVNSLGSANNNFTCLNASAYFNCTDGNYCIPIAQRCNQERDCLDGSDEIACNTSCVCTKGYQWKQGSCVDIDECKDFLSCSQICRNTPGSYTCSCVTGYSLDHRTFCRASPPLPYLLVAAGDRIVSLHPHPGAGLISAHTIFTKSDYKTQLEGATGLGIHYSDQLVIWSEKEGHTIVQDSITHSDMPADNADSPFIKDIRIKPVGIAIDWISDKVYWADDATGRIEVAELDGRNRMVLVSGIVRLSSIAVDAELGYLYWSISDPFHPRIVRSHMDGTHILTLHVSSLLQPTALAVDLPTHTLYWADAGTGRVECSDANGRNRRVLTSDRNIVHSPYSISVFEDTLYFTDTTTGSVSAVDKNGSSYRQIAIGLSNPRGLQVVHPSLQLGVSRSNPCLVNNGGCSHLCLLSNLSHSCHCPTPLISVNSSGCTYPSTLLLAVTGSSVRSITLNTQHSIDYQLELGATSNISAIEWEDLTQSLYWSEYHTGSIYVHKLNGIAGKSNILLQDPEISVVDLAYDWIHSIIYFIDARNQRIELISVLDTAMRKIVVSNGLSRVTSLVVNPVRGYLAWIDLQGTQDNKPVIMSAGTDGSNQRILVVRDLFRPTNLTLDFETDYLYWYDSHSRRVERVYFDGTRREIIFSVQFQLSAFAISNDSLFYSIEGSDTVLQYSLSGYWNNTVLTGLPNISYFSVYYPKSVLTSDFISPCFSTHTGCSHLCILTNNNNYIQNGNYAVCVCPNGFELSNSTHCIKYTGVFSTLLQHDGIYYSSLQNNSLVVLQTIYSTDILCTALDYSNFSSLFYAEKTAGGSVIKKITFETDSYAVANVSTLYSDLLSRVSDMVVEPTAQLLYWTDSAKGSIEVGTVEGGKRSVLIGHGIYKPKLLVLDSNTSRLYWVEMRESSSFINRVYLDGSNRELVVSLPNTQISSLAIATLSLEEDVVQYLLWTENSNVIFCYEVELEFTYSLSSLSSVHQSLRAYGSNLYWFDMESSQIYSATLIPGNPPRLHDIRPVLNTNRPISDIKMVSYHQMTFPLTPCAYIGQCSYLCLPNSKQSRHSCYCPVGILSTLDTYCPLLPSRFILISLHLQILYVSLDTAYTLPAMLYSEDKLITGAVDAYVPTRAAPLIIWSDITSRKSWCIKLMDTATREVSVLVEGVFTRGLAVDQMTGNLFFTDRYNRSINVCNLNTRAVKKLVDNDISPGEPLSKPRSVVVDPAEGYLFWTDWGHGTLERSRLDGSERKLLLSDSILTPSGLTIDRANKQLYWIDYAYKSIQSCDYNGFNRSTIVRNLLQPYSITLDYPSLYFTDWSNNTLNTLSLSHAPVSYYISYTSQSIIMDIQYIDTTNTLSGPCSVNNGGCSQICLQLGNGRAVCECSDQSADCVPAISTPYLTANSTNLSATDSPVYTSTNYLYILLFILSSTLVLVVVILFVLVLLLFTGKRRIKLRSPFSPARSFSENNPPPESPVRPAFTDAIFSLTSNSPSPPLQLLPASVDTEIIPQTSCTDPIAVSPQEGFTYNPLTQSATSTYSTPVQTDTASTEHTHYYTPGRELSNLKSLLMSTPKRFVARSKASYQLFPRLQESSNEQPSPTRSNYFGFSSLTPSKKNSSTYRSSPF